jgi:hypothetical protein
MIVASAVASVRTPGAYATGMCLRAAAATSMLDEAMWQAYSEYTFSDSSFCPEDVDHRNPSGRTPMPDRDVTPVPATTSGRGVECRARSKVEHLPSYPGSLRARGIEGPIRPRRFAFSGIRRPGWLPQSVGRDAARRGGGRDTRGISSASAGSGSTHGHSGARDEAGLDVKLGSFVVPNVTSADPGTSAVAGPL